MVRLEDGWQATLKAFTDAEVVPRLRNRTIRGVFVGDELVCGRSTLVATVLAPLISELRRLVGSEALLYANECTTTIAGNSTHYHEPPLAGNIPAELDLFSVDHYIGYWRTGDGAKEAAYIQAFAEKWLFPRMSPAQGLMLVPGTFACDDTKYVPLESEDAQTVAKIDAYYNWSKSEPRVAGMNPWHFNNWSYPVEPKGRCDMRLGAVVLPRTLDHLRQIGRGIIDGGRALAGV